MKYEELLSQWISHKSISTNKKYKDQIEGAVDWLKQLFHSNGFEVDVVEGFDNPIVVASFMLSKKAKTCLIYGHYDVQPADIDEGWDSDPFTLTQRDERLYARGVIDNKGQVLLHILTIIDLIKKKKLKYNVKFMIEGNEETGSPQLPGFIMTNKELLGADFALISDSDLHSGLFGGAVPNAIHELSVFIEKIYDKDNKIAINKFYDDVDKITKFEKNQHKEVPFEIEEYKRISGTKALLVEKNNNFYTQVSLRPAIIVSGITAGHSGEGYKNIVPRKASAKINFRLVKHQEPHRIAELFEAFVAQSLPKYVSYEFDVDDPYEGVKLNPDNVYVKRARKALEESYSATCLFKYCGGGLPIVTLIDEVLKIPQVVAPLANEDCAMHGANENFDLGFVHKGMKFSKSFFSK